MTMAAVNRRRFGVAVGAALGAPALLHAQSEKPPIKVLVGFPPGGATDAIARVVVDRLPAVLGQPVIIDNRPGAGGRLAADGLLAATPDGLTYMIAPNATPTFQVLVFGDRLRWNLFRDFTPVATLASYPLGMGVALNTGVTNAREFVEWARRNPGKASFGTPGLGGQNHFLGLQLAKAANIELQVTPYKGTPPMVTDLVGGHVPSAIGLMDGLMAHHRAGSIRVIGTFAPKRSPLMPDIPTFAEQGIPVTTGEGWTGMWAPAKTPPAELRRMQQAVQKVLRSPEVIDIMTTKLSVSPDYRDAEAMAAWQRAELAAFEPVIKASGFKGE